MVSILDFFNPESFLQAGMTVIVGLIALIVLWYMKGIFRELLRQLQVLMRTKIGRFVTRSVLAILVLGIIGLTTVYVMKQGVNYVSETQASLSNESARDEANRRNKALYDILALLPQSEGWSISSLFSGDKSNDTGACIVSNFQLLLPAGPILTIEAKAENKKNMSRFIVDVSDPDKIFDVMEFSVIQLPSGSWRVERESYTLGDFEDELSYNQATEKILNRLAQECDTKTENQK